MKKVEKKPDFLTYEEWLEKWKEVRSNYIEDGEEATETQLRSWYWHEIKKHHVTMRIKKGVGSV